MIFKNFLNIHGHIDWRGQDPHDKVGGLHFDSRQVTPGSAYVAVRGTSADGHDFIQSAIDKGAVALVVEDVSKVPSQYQGAVVEVLDARLSLQVLSQNFFGRPGDQMISLAVTGTNGKTSTTYIVEHLLNSLGSSCGVIGTINHHLRDKVWQTNLTSPDPVTLQGRLKDFSDAGADSFVIEASSHALFQKRLNQGFDGVMFTNLSRDHLDYHKTMDEYFQAKALLFSEAMLKEGSDGFAVINGDDEYSEKLISQTLGRRIFTFGKNQGNDFRFSITSHDLSGSQVELSGPNDLKLQFHIPLVGEHNVYNVVGVLVLVYGLGKNITQATESLKSFKGIPGRMQSLDSTKGVFGVVDYAHTPDALEKVLLTLRREIKATAKIISVFGCGGDRDKGKRPEMGRIASKNSDVCVVTSDNPRSEDPNAILNDILKGISEEFQKSPQCLVEVDRRAAIQKATEIASPGDVVLVAGKGHENYQIIGDNTLDFDDIEVLAEFLGDQ